VTADPAGGASPPQFSALRLEPLFAAITLHFPTMISTDTFSHIENIQKRSGHLWRFL